MSNVCWNKKKVQKVKELLEKEFHKISPNSTIEAFQSSEKNFQLTTLVPKELLSVCACVFVCVCVWKEK